MAAYPRLDAPHRRAARLSADAGLAGGIARGRCRRLVPYVNIRITRERATAAQKAELIAGVTELLRRVLAKNPATTVVNIDEVDLDNWGVGGLPVAEYRALKKPKEPTT